MASRLYWIIIDEEDNTHHHVEYVYIVHRDKLDLEFAYKTKADAMKCVSRLKSMYPEESDYIYIRKLVLRSNYK